MQKYNSRILIIAFLFVVQTFLGQSVPCNNEVSTDPNAPKNLQLPQIGEIQPDNSIIMVPDIRYLNGTHWYQPNSSGILNQLPTDNMLNQVDAIGNPTPMNNPFSNQQSAYYGYIYGGEEPLPENGWELLGINLGFYPDGTPLISDGEYSEFTDLPYLILYNRYQGVIRLFASSGEGLTQGVAFNGVKVSLAFEQLANADYASGLLRLNDEYDTSLDQETKVEKVVSLAEHPNSANKWFSADFQIAYDPCTCMYPSDIKVDFEFITTSTIDLIGREIQMESDLINGPLANQKDFLSNFEYDLNGSDEEAQGGMIMYKTIETLVDDYIDQMENYKDSLSIVQTHNAEVDKALVVVKMFKKVVLNAVGGAVADITGSIAGTILFGEFELLVGELVGVDSIDVDGLTKKAQEFISKQLTKFIGEKWSKLKEPTAPVSPTATFSEMRFQGKIETGFQFSGPTFYNPGTFNASSTTSSVHEYPVYNEVLGVFALLEAPKLEIAEFETFRTQTTINQTIPVEVDNSCTGTDPNSLEQIVYKANHNKELKQTTQFKLSSPLKYTFNPTLDIKDVDIKVALVAKVTRNETDLSFLNQFDYTFGNATLVSVETNPNPIWSSNLSSNQVTPNVEIPQPDQMPSNMPSLDYVTPFLPIDAFMGYTGGFSNKHDINYDVVSSYQDFVEYNSGDLSCQGFQAFGSGTYGLHASVNGNGPMTNQELSTQFDYTVAYELKLMVDVEFYTERSDGGTNSLSQVYTYQIDDMDIDLTANFFDLSLGSQAINSLKENVKFVNSNFDGSPVDDCVLNGSIYTCRCWNDMTIEGAISIDPGFKVDFIAGNEIYVVNNTGIPVESTLSIVPVLDYSEPMPEASEDYVINFCNGTNPNAPSYQANITKNRIWEENEESNDGIEESSKLDKLIFQLFPNPATDIVWLAYSKQSEEQVSFTITDLSGKVVWSQEGGDLSGLGDHKLSIDTKGLAKGFYVCTLKDGDRSRSKQLIVQ